MAFVVDHGRPLTRAVPDLLFFSNYVNGIVGGGWSLSTEEQFYLLAPVLLLLIRHLPPARRYLPLVAIFALLPAIRLTTYIAWKNSGGELPPPEMVLLSPFHTHADGLLLGLVLAWLSVTIPTMTATRPLAANLPLTVTLAVAGVVLRQIDKDAFAFTGLALLYGAMTLFILRDDGATTRWTSFRGFHVISRLSYGMYLNHFLVLSRLPGWFGDRPMLNAAGRSVGYAQAFSTAQFVPLFVGTIASSAAIAFVSFCLVERPFLLLRESWLKTREMKQSARPVGESASV
jgi:peptidoglycan/LPS O-acetylase OafA/YrhL